MKRFFVVFLAFNLYQAFPVMALEETDKEMFAVDYRAAEKFKSALKNNDKNTVAEMVHYPLQREKPLPDITNDKDFVSHWDEYFDEESIKIIVESEPDQIGWRGINLANGSIWFHEGKIITINTKTKAYEKAWNDSKKVESDGLYASAKGYDKLQFQCITKNFRIRVQEHGGDLRYFAWKKDQELTDKPNLELGGGKLEYQGTGGNYDMFFKNGNYSYQISIGHNLCGETCDDYLVVTEGDKELLRQICS